MTRVLPSVVGISWLATTMAGGFSGCSSTPNRPQRSAAAAPADPFPRPLSGCVPETGGQLSCQSTLATALARLVPDLSRCHLRHASAVFRGSRFDLAGCEQVARTRFEAAVSSVNATNACPGVAVRNARWLAANLLGGRSIAESLNALNGALFCDPTSGSPIDAGSGEAGFVPSSAATLTCAERAGKNLARLARRARRCLVLGAAAGVANRSFDVAACMNGPGTGARARYDVVARRLARRGLCPPCLGAERQAALADDLVGRLGEDNELVFVCDTGSLQVSFVDGDCPSRFAPAACAAGRAQTCHEAFVLGAADEGCHTGHGDRATYLVPKDAAADGGVSRAWSFAIRPRERGFHSLYPEVTGSVRATSDGRGAAGSSTGASDEAHLRLSIGHRASRLLVLRWFTGGLPPGSTGQLRVTAGSAILLDATEAARQPRAGLRVWPVTWEGDLEVTVSAGVSGPRDRPTSSADLLWQLAVLRPKGDDDGDGIPNEDDPDPLDGSVPGPRPASGRPKVLIVGLDGAGWDVLHPLVDAGYLRVMGRIIRGGVIAAVDETVASPGDCCYCPPNWSTLATGQPLARHGMAWIESEPWGRPVPSIAQVLARHGGTSTQVDYRNTFPAEPGTTYDVTEAGTTATAVQDLYTVFGGGVDPRGEYLNRLQWTWPPLLFERLGILPASGSRPKTWIAFAQDRVGADALLRLAKVEPTDLTMWILHSIDKAEHVDWGAVQPSVDAPLDVARLLDQAARWTGPAGPFGTVASQYLEADHRLGELLDSVRHAYDYLVLLSDHAMARNPSPFGLPGMHNIPPAFHGVFALAGPGVRAGVDLGEISAFDVAPTLAYLLDLPVGGDLPGRVLKEAFTAEQLAARPVRRAPSWVESITSSTASRAPQSIVRQWDEEALSAIRRDTPRPPVHARNLFHLSVAMWDAWVAYDQTRTAAGYLTTEHHTSTDPEADRAQAISFAAYRVLSARYAHAAGGAASLASFDARMDSLGYDRTFTSTDGDVPAAVGNRVAAAVLAYGTTDGANEATDYADPTYRPVNAPLVVKLPGTTMVDPNRWQPLALDFTVNPKGIRLPTKVQTFIGSRWGTVKRFAFDLASNLPPPPPHLGDDLYRQGVVDTIRKSSMLTRDDGADLDISPAVKGNNPLGTNDGTGYAVNPVTGAPYASNVVKRGDWARVLAEFWADGPSSESPPGHWNVIANYASDHLEGRKRVGGTGPLLNDLEWDVKLYLALNGALHDAAIGCWGTKRQYDAVRPISAIRYMAGLGQSSDPSQLSYDARGLPLIPGLIEPITPATTAPGQRHAALAGHEGEIALYAWPGRPADSTTQSGGVQWIRAVTWVPYQKTTLVTPAFPGYTSGHSTFSRSAAEILTAITGSAFFPGGLGEFVAPRNAFLKLERGPSETVTLQWATYYDAADDAGISRLYGGIHSFSDDFEGRIMGAKIGQAAFALARQYFAGTVSH